MKPSRSLIRTCLTTAASVALVILGTPILLELVRRIYPYDWQTLSAIGQSYTGAATILSVLAFAGVLYSVILQSRQNIGQQQQASREMQFRLMGMAIDDPDFGEIWSRSGSMSREAHSRFRRDAYMVFLFRYLQYSYVVGLFTDDNLRARLREEVFIYPHFRQRWLQVEPIWRDAYDGIELKFCVIAGEECRAADPEA